MTRDGFSDFTDIDAVIRIPRLTTLTAYGDRIVAAIAQANATGSKLVSSLWELGDEPARRLTWSVKGESSPRFAPDGSLLFVSARPDPQSTDGDDGVAAIWRLPATGEAQVVATTPGGLALLDVADDGTMLASTSVLVGGTLENDAERRKARKDSARTDIWHTGMPIRYWDHEVGDVSPRLVRISPDGDITDLAPDADTLYLQNASASIAHDGSAIYTTWMTRVAGGLTRTSIMRIDAKSRRRKLLVKASAEHSWAMPRVSPDGRRLALIRATAPSHRDTSYDFLEIHAIDGSNVVAVDVGDLTIGEVRWVDEATLLVSGDWHSRGQVLAVDAATGKVKVLADDAAYSSLAVAGKSLYALRSAVDTPPRPVRLSLGRRSPAVQFAAPGSIAALPGKLERVETDVDGVPVGAWLCTPHQASTKKPAPVMLWIHGGPHASYNAWSWRWNPWLAVARGYAVLMPDPAMSTGYGYAGLNRGWPRRADVVWRECEALLDLVLRRRTLDGSRTALLGASFGGYMTNWVAGHTGRFAAIVTHAGLWALDQQHKTTDMAAHKMRVHGELDDMTEWYRTYSPHYTAKNITTPMLVTHGNRDYRVPVSEGTRLWWDLVSQWKGKPADMPHRFLQFTSENHWVLTPANSRVWNEAVLAFCDQHVLGADPIPDALPW